MSKLFAVYLGGSASKANIELHDVVFVTGEAIEDTYIQLLDKWFGSSTGLHLDSWVELSVIDGFRVRLTTDNAPADNKLFFINFGAYRHGNFMEFHVSKFLVGKTASEVKAKARRELTEKFDTVIHMDDLYDLDECLQIQDVNGFRVVLEPTSEQVMFLPNNGYHIIPKKIVEEYLVQRLDLRVPHHNQLNKIK